MALTNDWSSTYEASPANSDNASEGASKIRGLKQDTRERLNVDHYVGNTSVVTPSAAQITNNDTGYHRQVTIGEKSAVPSTPSSTFAEIFNFDVNSDQIPTFVTDAGSVKTMVTMLSRTAVDLTSTGTTNLFLVPSSTILLLTDIWLEGKVAQSGGTASTLKIGVSGTLDQLNTTSGHAFTSASATTLLPVGQRMKVSSLYAPSNMNDILTKSFAATNQLIADVSGTVVTAGQVYVELWGTLIQA